MQMEMETETEIHSKIPKRKRKTMRRKRQSIHGWLPFEWQMGNPSKSSTWFIWEIPNGIYNIRTYK